MLGNLEANRESVQGVSHGLLRVAMVNHMGQSSHQVVDCFTENDLGPTVLAKELPIVHDPLETLVKLLFLLPLHHHKVSEICK